MWPWLALAAAWAVCIGLTRVLLGVHWASDVAAGCCLGLASLGLAAAALAVGGRTTPQAVAASA